MVEDSWSSSYRTPDLKVEGLRPDLLGFWLITVDKLLTPRSFMFTKQDYCIQA